VLHLTFTEPYFSSHQATFARLNSTLPHNYNAVTALFSTMHIPNGTQLPIQLQYRVNFTNQIQHNTIPYNTLPMLLLYSTLLHLTSTLQNHHRGTPLHIGRTPHHFSSTMLDTTPLHVTVLYLSITIRYISALYYTTAWHNYLNFAATKHFLPCRHWTTLDFAPLHIHVTKLSQALPSLN
jgi:hypothetical protein